jgi:hypothetical protein
MKARIYTKILSGNLGDGWINEGKAAEAFGSFLKDRLETEARAFLEGIDDADITAEVDVQKHSSGYSGELRVDGWDDDGAINTMGLEDHLREVQHEAWTAWLETEEAAELATDGA